MPEAHVRGHLELMWDSAYQSGDPYLGDASDVEAAAGWAGEPGKLAHALAKSGGEGRSGFIDELGDGTYQVHDLEDHAPHYVKRRQRREEERKGGREASARPVTSQRATGDEPACDQCAPSPSLKDEDGFPPTPAPTPAPTPETASAARPPGGEAPPLLVFPCVGGKGSGDRQWSLTRERVTEWEETFPGMDVLGECREALAWVRAKPERRKTARGMPKFLLYWLGKALDSGTFRRRDGSPPPPRGSLAPRLPLAAPGPYHRRDTPEELAAEEAEARRALGVKP